MNFRISSGAFGENVKAVASVIGKKAAYSIEAMTL